MNLKIIFISLFSIITQNVFGETRFKWLIDETLHHQIKVAREFSKEIELKTKGKVKIDLILHGQHNGDIGPEANSIDRINSGAVDIHQSIVGNYINLDPRLQVWDFPFLFNDDEHIERYIKSKSSQDILKKLTNDKVVAVNYSFAGGFLHFYSNQKMNSFLEIKNKKCHFSPSFVFLQHFLRSIKLRSSEEKVATCGEILSSEIDSLYFNYDMSKTWINITKHRVVSRITMVSQKKIAKLSLKNRTFFLKHLRKSLERERRLVYEATKIAFNLLQNRGARINFWTKEQRLRDKKYFSSFYKNMNLKAKNEMSIINSFSNESLATYP